MPDKKQAKPVEANEPTADDTANNDNAKAEQQKADPDAAATQNQSSVKPDDKDPGEPDKEHDAMADKTRISNAERKERESVDNGYTAKPIYRDADGRRCGEVENVDGEIVAFFKDKLGSVVEAKQLDFIKGTGYDTENKQLKDRVQQLEKRIRVLLDEGA